MFCLASPTITASVSVSGSIALIFTCRPFGINSKSISFMDFLQLCYYRPADSSAKFFSFG